MSKVRVAVAGCGSVSTKYIPHLQNSSQVEVVAVCDNLLERAQGHAQRYGIERYFTDIDRMLTEVDFELFVNLTPMPFHAPFNRKALEAGRNVWCEKPIATTMEDANALLALAKQRGVGLYGAPNSPTSPAFQQIARLITSGELGQVHVAHGIYGWSGPTWAGTAWYYKKGGGSLFDLGVYNVTTLTGLLGPVRAVTAMSGSAIAERIIEGEARPVKVESDDNTAIILDHGNTVYSVVQTGFVYGAQREDWTIQVIGTQGAATMGGYDWEPYDVTFHPGAKGTAGGKWETQPYGRSDYAWEGGATYIAECLASGTQPVVSGEHPVHVLEVMLAAFKSAETGQRVAIESSFPWPLYR